MNRRRAILAALIPLVVLALISLDAPTAPGAEGADVRTAALGDGNRHPSVSTNRSLVDR